MCSLSDEKGSVVHPSSFIREILYFIGVDAMEPTHMATAVPKLYMPNPIPSPASVVGTYLIYCFLPL